MKKPPRKAIAKKAVAKKRNSGNIFVMPDGSTIGGRDIGKIKPTPKPTPKPKVTPKKTPKMTPQDAAMLKILKDRYGW
jgi:hypothetical protein